MGNNNDDDMAGSCEDTVKKKYSLRTKRKRTSKELEYHDEGKSVTSKSNASVVCVGGKGKNGVKSENHYEGWSIPPLPSDISENMKPLMDNKIKKDLRRIRSSLTGNIVEDYIEKCDSEEEFALELVNKQKDRISKSKKSGKKKTNNAEAIYGIATDFMSSNNFYFPFKKLKEWQELKDYHDFVNQQTYLSARHAYVSRIEVLHEKRIMQAKVLDKMHQHYDSVLSGTLNHQYAMKQCGGVLNKSLEALNYYKYKVELLEAENSKLRKSDKKSDISNRDKKNNDSNNNNKNNKKKRKKKEELDVVEQVFDMLAIHTTFGFGLVNDIYFKQGKIFCCVKLQWGATAFLTLDTINFELMDESERFDFEKEIEKLLDEQPIENNTNTNDNDDNLDGFDCNNNNENTEIPVMFTRTEYGPPRGVKLDFCKYSKEEDMVVAPRHPYPPTQLKSLYNTQNMLDTRFVDTKKEIEQYKRYKFSDNDTETVRREIEINSVPYSWGKDSSLYKNIEEDMEKQEQQDADMIIASLRSNVSKLESELMEKSKICKIQEKIIIDNRGTFENLRSKLLDLQMEQASLKRKIENVDEPKNNKKLKTELDLKLSSPPPSKAKSFDKAQAKRRCSPRSKSIEIRSTTSSSSSSSSSSSPTPTPPRLTRRTTTTSPSNNSKDNTNKRKLINNNRRSPRSKKATL